jgi:hypothetical protein
LIEADLLSQSDDSLELRVVGRILPCFLSAQGRDITEGPDAIRRESTWSLRKIDDQWAIHRGVIEAETKVKGDHPTC